MTRLNKKGIIKILTVGRCFKMIDNSIRKLVCYGLEKELFTKRDEIYVTNRLLEILGLDSFSCDEDYNNVNLEETLKELLDYAVSAGLTEDGTVYRDLFDTRLMGALMPRPSEVTDRFYGLYKQSPKAATDYFYRLSCDSDYIRRYRVEKDIKWITKTEYGDLDITINLSKPEKDPKAIAAAKNAPQAGYPKCMLCRECEGYAGRINFPARQNHRVIPVKINNTDWCFQYSPYVYYNEHCIVFNEEHTPMKIDRSVFVKLLDFVSMFPHYTIGSNADLPIVGGSILSHDHFQGGAYTFAMAKAPYEYKFNVTKYEDVTIGIVKWPMSVIRLQSENKESIVELSSRILDSWRAYTDQEAFIYSETDGVPHNTITPIARMNGSLYEMDLVLRNNITTEEKPWGVYHPDEKLHHIKKENIGLIEVMGLAVLPARLKKEMEELADAIIAGKDIRAIDNISKHAEWVDEWYANYEITSDNIKEVLHIEIAKRFVQVLECAGVFKRTEKGMEQFKRFLSVL